MLNDYQAVKRAHHLAVLRLIHVKGNCMSGTAVPRRLQLLTRSKQFKACWIQRWTCLSFYCHCITKIITPTTHRYLLITACTSAFVVQASMFARSQHIHGSVTTCVNECFVKR
jgi:hypothetical protein